MHEIIKGERRKDNGGETTAGIMRYATPIKLIAVNAGNLNKNRECWKYLSGQVIIVGRARK